MIQREILPLHPFEAVLVDTTRYTVVLFSDVGKPPVTPPVDTRTILELKSTEAALVDTTKIRVVPAQE